MSSIVAIASSRVVDGIHLDDLMLKSALRQVDIGATVCVWDDPGINWRDYDAIVVRSTWDYVRRYDEFIEWLDRLDAMQVRTINPTSMLRWNSDKRYLSELSRCGIPIVPTQFVGGAGIIEAAHRWSEREVVVKPSVSASAWHTIRGTPGDQGFVDAANRLPCTMHYLVQPFLPQIATSGEWSLIYFGGAFSHAMLKQPAPGDYRVQSEFGGTSRPEIPPEWVLESSHVVLEALASLGIGESAYARVDGVVVDDSFLLMELELIEPHLHLSANAGAAAAFAEQLRKRLALELDAQAMNVCGAESGP